MVQMRDRWKDYHRLGCRRIIIVLVHFISMFIVNEQANIMNGFEVGSDANQLVSTANQLANTFAPNGTNFSVVEESD